MNRAEFLKAVVSVTTLAAVGCGDSETENLGTGGSTTSNNGGGGSGNNGGGGSNTGGGGSGNTGGSGGAGGSGQGGAGGGGAGCTVDINAQISCRHDHEMIITAADLIAGVQKVYDIRGTQLTHGHDVTVTAAMFTQLQNGETVEIAVPSTNIPHRVVIKCTGLDPSALDAAECPPP